ncbi:hypothetical protein [Gordonia amicalis]|uniref:hypothetical protein n=1 Tax=Gordonia amicalis TaxID=89053 RepID=UPI0015F5D23F|nr:hypothetical protein [Gordonia amicalis]MBA5845702.1 hypothetical protein [Gordonia amicalis]
MSKDSEPESRPISVSELLARSQAAGGTTPTRRDGRGRRRAGRDGSVSVSELTGEIPKINDASAPQADEKIAPADKGASAEAREAEAPTVEAPEAEPTEATTTEAEATETTEAEATEAATPAAPESAAPAASEAKATETEPTEAKASEPKDTGISADKTASGPATRGWSPTGWSGTETPGGPFPRSGNPVARRAADDRPVADRPRPDRPFAPGGRTASGMPGFGATPPATRDFSSDAVARRMSPPRDSEPVDEESANAVTGIIPMVDGADGGTDEGLVVVESDDVVTHDLTEVDSGSGPRERGDSGFSDVMDFDAYRNFADVEGDAGPGAQPTGTSRLKGAKALGGLARKLFGRKGAAAAVGSGTQAGTSAAEDTGTRSVPGGRARAAAARARRDDDNPTEIIEPIAPPEDDSTREDTARDETRPEETRPEETEAWQASAQWYDTEAWSAPVVDEEDNQQDETTPEPAEGSEAVVLSKHETARVEETTDLDETPDVVADGSSEETAAISAGAADSEQGKVEKPAVAGSEVGEPEAGEERSPALAWLLILGQAVVGLLVGIGLFWGFTELWRWNPYFALVLAVLVIFGIVTLSHVVRRTKDLATTLLALGVGLLVTIGPLVLLAT